MKILSVAADLFHTGGRTDIQSDIRKLIAAFGNFAKSPKNCDEDSVSFGIVDPF